MFLDQYRHAKLFTDTGCSKLWNLLVARHRGPAIGRRVLPDRVFSPFPHEPTTMLTQVAQQVAPLHETVVWGTMLI